MQDWLTALFEVGLALAGSFLAALVIVRAALGVLLRPMR